MTNHILFLNVKQARFLHLMFGKFTNDWWMTILPTKVTVWCIFSNVVMISLGHDLLQSLVNDAWGVTSVWLKLEHMNLNGIAIQVDKAGETIISFTQICLRLWFNKRFYPSHNYSGSFSSSIVYVFLHMCIITSGYYEMLPNISSPFSVVFNVIFFLSI